MALKESTSPFDNNFLVIKHHAICKELNPKPATEEERAEAIAKKYREITVDNPSEKVKDPETGQMVPVKVQKWIRTFGSVDGKITGLDWYDRVQQINNRKVRFMGLKMKLKDGAETFILDLPFNTRGYDVYTRVMENIDYNEPIEISVWKEKNSNNTVVLFRQNGDTVKWRYTKDYNQRILADLYDHNSPLAPQFDEAIERGEMSEELHEKLTNAGYVVAPFPIRTDFMGKVKWDFDIQTAWIWQRLQNVVIPLVQELNPKFDEPVPELSDDPDGVPFGPDDIVPRPAPSAQAAAQAAAADPSLSNGGFTGPPPAAPQTKWTPPGAPTEQSDF